MIAFARFELPEDVAAEARRRVGGRALQVSEYAARLLQAVDEMMRLVDQGHSWDPQFAWVDDVVDRFLELDGRAEALRLRLGIEAMEARTFLPFYSHHTDYGRIEQIGFFKLRIYRKGDWPAEGDLTIVPLPEEDWRFRLKSLRSIAKELAVSPDLDPEEEAIVGLIVSVGHRMTTTQILDEFSRRGAIKGESTIKGKLAQLTKRKVLVNRSDTNPKGYGLPEWQ